MQHAFQSKHSHSTPGISIYFHTPSCCDVARIHWPCSMYQLVQKVHLKGYSIQTVASKIHMKYCWIQSDCQPDPVPVAVNSKNLVIDSATCSDCIELYHLELHCISKKNHSSKTRSPEFQTDIDLTKIHWFMQSSLHHHHAKTISMHMETPG